jgi:Ankyrin repeats (3 copies)
LDAFGLGLYASCGLSPFRHTPRREIHKHREPSTLGSIGSEDVDVLELVVRCVRTAKMLDAPNKLGQTLLHLAAGLGNMAMVSKLLEYGASLTARDADGWFPLHAAAFNCCTEVRNILFDQRYPAVMAMRYRGMITWPRA